MGTFNSAASTALLNRSAAIPWAARAAATAEPQAQAPLQESDETFVETFARGLAVIRSFANRHDPLTIAEVARRAGVSRSSARRLLYTLVRLGYASMADQTFTLLPKTLLLAGAFLSSDVLATLGKSIVAKVSGATGMFCAVDVPQGHTSLLVCMAYKVKPAQINLPEPNVGMVAPMYCSSGGLLFLSDFSEAELDTYFRDVKLHAYTHLTMTDPLQVRQRLERVRQSGYALVDRELSVQLRSISVPITDRAGRTLGGLMLLAPAELDSLEELEATLPTLRGAARELSSML